MECLLIKCVPGTVMDMEKESGEQNLKLLPCDQYMGYFSNFKVNTKNSIRNTREETKFCGGHLLHVNLKS